MVTMYSKSGSMIKCREDKVDWMKSRGFTTEKPTPVSKSTVKKSTDVKES